MIINTEMLIQELKDLHDEFENLTKESHERTKQHPVESGWWNFYVGQMDAHGTARWKLKALLEKYS